MGSVHHRSVRALKWKKKFPTKQWSSMAITSSPDRPLTRHILLRCAFLLFRFCLLVIPKISYKNFTESWAEKNFRFLIFLRSKVKFQAKQKKKQHKRHENKSSFQEMSPWGHRSFSSSQQLFLIRKSPFVCRNEIVNIKVGVAECCPRDIISAFWNLNKKTNHDQ